MSDDDGKYKQKRENEKKDDGTKNSMTTAKRQRCHPLHRRLLAVPTANDWEILSSDASRSSSKFDAYENPSAYSIYIDRRRPRPMPSSQILTSTIGTNDTSREAPILQAFFKAIGIPNKQATAAKANKNPKEDDNNEESDGKSLSSCDSKDDIDNTNLSQLTAGQHERYLRLISSKTVRTIAERKEFKALSHLIRAEQIRYRHALVDFHAKYVDRYKPTNDPNHVAFLYYQWACRSHHQPIIPSNKNLKPQYPRLYATKFGNCRQRISLPQPQASRNEGKKLDLVSLQFEPVHASDTPDTFPTLSDDMCAVSVVVGSLVIPPKPQNSPIPTPLDQDEQIRILAQKHNAAIATTAETLQTLMKPPASYGSGWMVPLSTSTNVSAQDQSTVHKIRFLGPPAPQAYTTPRECFEHGLQEGLYQSLQHKEKTKKTKQDDNERRISNSKMIQYFYTVWTLPQIRRRQPVRILIRSEIRCHDKGEMDVTDGSDYRNNKKPVILHVHAEYFCDRQVVEIPNAYERAIWILDQLLLGNDAINNNHNVAPAGSVRWVRVDAQTCQIVGSEEVSVAHALAIEEGEWGRDDPNDKLTKTSRNNDPILLLEALVHILQAIPTIDCDQASLLCLDPQQHSVSVHAAINTTNKVLATKEAVCNRAPAAAIDFDCLPNANGIVLTSEALKNCARDWKWNSPDRVPNTFPVKKRQKEKSARLT